MTILYIYRNPNMGVSIGKVFKPIEQEMKKYAEIDSIYLPSTNYSIKGLGRNILYVQKVIIKKWMYIVKYIFTVSITLTGMVYCFLLAPTAGEEFDTWSIHNVLTHIVVPLFSIIDLFVEKYNLKIKNKNVFLVILPPLYYFIISLICYFNNVEFIEGQNYPYFFLNHSSPAKVFGFSNVPIYMGSFYWIVILLIFILSMGFLYKFIYNKVNNKKAD